MEKVRIRYACLIAGIMMFCVSACYDDDYCYSCYPPPPPPPPPSSIPETLYSTSFEKGNLTDLSGWEFYYAVDSGFYIDTLVASACPGGGNWALNLYAPRMKTSYARKFLTGLSGSKNLTLYFSASLLSGQNTLTASLIQHGDSSIIDSAGINTGVWSYWRQFSFSKVLNLQPDDSLEIRFTARGNTYESAYAHLDLLKLAKSN